MKISAILLGGLVTCNEINEDGHPLQSLYQLKEYADFMVRSGPVEKEKTRQMDRYVVSKNYEKC